MNIRKTAVLVAIGPMIGAAEVVGLVAHARMVHVPASAQSMLSLMINDSILCGVFLPLVVHWCERDPLRTGTLARLIPRHVTRLLAYTVASAVLIGLARAAAHVAFGMEALSVPELAGRILNGWLIAGAFVYVLVLGIVSTLSAQRDLHAKELAEAGLRTALAETEIKLLKAELDPHFIFNALHTITNLVHRDPATAERTLCRLSDFLRLSFATAGAQEVPLQQELEHLESYMAIQMVRFRGRLFLETDVPIELLGCRVPNLLLQPLVENIVKHAVAPTEITVHARIRARRHGDLLRIETLDDGPGLPAARPLLERVGLANTRGRLRLLYGDGHRMILESRVPTGTRALVELPYNLMPDAEGPQGDTAEEVPHVTSTHR